MIRTVLIAAIAAASLSGCAAAQPATPLPPGEVTGTLIWREKILLPPSTVTVQLLDVSRMDAPATVLATQEFEGVRSPPVAFRLAYDPAVIEENHRYTVSARVVTPDGQLRFITDTHNAVITNHVHDLKIVAKGVAR